jgi:hypothetical protein
VTKKKQPMNRENYIIGMYDFGNKGIEDYDHLHKKIIPASEKLVKKSKYGMRLKKLDSTLDVEGYDMPRKDVERVRIEGGKYIRIGGDTIKRNAEYFKKYIIPAINRSFTRDELNGTEIYIEYPSKSISNKFDGLATHYDSDKNIKFTIIDLARKKDIPGAVHEILHAVRFSKNKMMRNRNIDEAETDLETLMRLSKYERKKLPCNDGYYQFVKGKNICKARSEDEKLIEQNCNIKNKKGLSQCIKKNLKKTNIGKIKIPKRLHP